MIDKQPKTGVIAADGTGRLSWSPTRGQNWVIQQVSISAPNVGGSATCEFFINNNSLGPLVAQSDNASGAPYVPCHNGETFSVRWNAGTVGAQINGVILYDDGN